MRHLSKTTVLTCVALFAAGLAAGAVAHAERSPSLDRHVSGPNAVPAHVVLAVLAVGIAVILPRIRLGRRAPYPIWLAPFSRSALERVERTVLVRSGASPVSILRALVAGLLVLVLLFNAFRAGEQVVGGLDPNFTINAWGGPSYLGAMLAHYLDAVILFYAEAFVLNLILVRSTEGGTFAPSAELAARGEHGS